MKNKKPRKPKTKVILKDSVEFHLRKLEGDERKFALKNLTKARAKIRVKTLSQALFQAFQFQDTPQGFEYWKKVFDRELAKENAN